MKISIDKIFVAYMLGLLVYVQLKPGTQMIPPWWNPEERMKWKPSLFFWVNMSIIIGFILFKQLNIK